jgi:SDR family mycofactocin-dependent oxidoreductase
VGRVNGKVAFITGAGRGQGRSHAVRLAEEGANIIAVDICHDIDTCPYPLSTMDDLEETARLVEKTGQKIVIRQADVRDLDALKAAAAAGVAEFGSLDIVAANACIGGAGPLLELSSSEWQTMLDVGLTGVWHTIKATVPTMIDQGRGGSVVVTSSAAGLKALMNCGHYVAAKHGVIGMVRTLANEIASHNIRVNAVCPSSVKTPMMLNDWTYRLFRPDLEEPGLDDCLDTFKSLQILDIPFVDPVDISNAVLFLASDEARYITGVARPVDGGALAAH